MTRPAGSIEIALEILDMDRNDVFYKVCKLPTGSRWIDTLICTEKPYLGECHFTLMLKGITRVLADGRNSEGEDTFYPNDSNINGGGYNHHYAFKNRADAMAYFDEQTFTKQQMLEAREKLSLEMDISADI